MKSKRFYYTKKISEVFLKYGINSLTVDEVADVIGVTKKTLYNYFDSKHQMVECFLDYLSTNQKKEVSDMLLQSKTPIDALVNLSRSIYSMSQTFHNRVRPEIQPRYQDSIMKILSKRREELYDYILFNFNKGVSMGLFENDLDITLWSKFYLFEMENLFLSNNRFKPLLMNQNDLDQILYYQMKGMCTPHGQDTLRKLVNFKVDLDKQA